MIYKMFQGFKILFLLFVLCGGSTLWAYEYRTIYPQNDDISLDLDLDAVASVFGRSSSLEDFEYRLNDPEAQISNLDINEDGYVDYLRVIEKAEDDTRLVIIQALLDEDTYQDVATIVIQRDGYEHTSVEIVGDSSIYGTGYILEPTYSYTPIIYTYFWSSRYDRTYHSRYRWGHYPTRYRRWRSRPTPHYHKHIYHHIDRRNHYRYRGSVHKYHNRTKSYGRLQKRDSREKHRRHSHRTHNTSSHRTYTRSSTSKERDTIDYKAKIVTHNSTKRYYNSKEEKVTIHYRHEQSSKRVDVQANRYYDRDTRRRESRAYLQTR